MRMLPPPPLPAAALAPALTTMAKLPVSVLTRAPLILTLAAALTAMVPALMIPVVTTPAEFKLTAPFRLTVLCIVMSPPACRFNAPMPVLLIALNTLMLRLAFNVSALPLLQLIAFCTEISPKPPWLDAVSIVTLLLPSAACSTFTFSVELGLFISVNTPELLLIPDELGSLLIAISVGSSSKVPVLPWLAVVSTAPVKFSVCLPEVSTKPPSPERAPPLAEMAPAKSRC